MLPSRGADVFFILRPPSPVADAGFFLFGCCCFFFFFFFTFCSPAPPWFTHTLSELSEGPGVAVGAVGAVGEPMTVYDM